MWRPRANQVYNSRFPRVEQAMFEINPIAHQINDLQGRLESLRGYL